MTKKGITFSLKGNVESLKKSLSTAKKGLISLGKSFSSSARDTNNASKASNSFKSSLSGVTSKASQASAALGKTGKSLNSTTSSLKNVDSSAKKTGTSIVENMRKSSKSVDHLVATIDELRSKMSDTRALSKQGLANSVAFGSPNLKSVATLGAGSIFGTAGIATAGAAIGGAKSVGNFSNFESGMKSIQAVTQASTKDMAALEGLIEQLAFNTKFDLTDIQGAIFNLGTLGVKADNNAKQFKQLAPEIVNAAIALDIDLASAAEKVLSTMKQFDTPFEKAESVVDLMAGAYVNSSVNAERFSVSMQFAGLAAKTFKRPLEDILPIIMSLIDQGIDASMAGSQMRTAFLNLLKPTAGAQAAIESMGLGLEDVSVESHGFIGVLEKLRDKGLTATQAVEIFGVRSAPMIQALLNMKKEGKVGIAVLKDYQEKITKTGIAKQNAATKATGLKFAFDQIAASTGILLKNIGEFLSKVLPIESSSKLIATSIGKIAEAVKWATNSLKDLKMYLGLIMDAAKDAFYFFKNDFSYIDLKAEKEKAARLRQEMLRTIGSPVKMKIEIDSKEIREQFEEAAKDPVKLEVQTQKTKKTKNITSKELDKFTEQLGMSTTMLTSGMMTTGGLRSGLMAGANLVENRKFGTSKSLDARLLATTDIADIQKEVAEKAFQQSKNLIQHVIDSAESTFGFVGPTSGNVGISIGAMNKLDESRNNPLIFGNGKSMFDSIDSFNRHMDALTNAIKENTAVNNDYSTNITYNATSRRNQVAPPRRDS